MEKLARITKVTTKEMPLWNEEVAREVLGSEDDEQIIVSPNLSMKWRNRHEALGNQTRLKGFGVSYDLPEDMMVAISGSDIADDELNDLISEATGEFEARNLDALKSDAKSENQVLTIVFNGDGIEELQEFLML